MLSSPPPSPPPPPITFCPAGVRCVLISASTSAQGVSFYCCGLSFSITQGIPTCNYPGATGGPYTDPSCSIIYRPSSGRLLSSANSTRPARRPGREVSTTVSRRFLQGPTPAALVQYMVQGFPSPLTTQQAATRLVDPVALTYSFQNNGLASATGTMTKTSVPQQAPFPPPSPPPSPPPPPPYVADPPSNSPGGLTTTQQAILYTCVAVAALLLLFLLLLLIWCLCRRRNKTKVVPEPQMAPMQQTTRTIVHSPTNPIASPPPTFVFIPPLTPGEVQLQQGTLVPVNKSSVPRALMSPTPTSPANRLPPVVYVPSLATTEGLQVSCRLNQSI